MSVNRFSLRTHPWIWRDVLAPLLIVRLVLLWVGWLASYFPVWPRYPQIQALERGWLYSPYRCWICGGDGMPGGIWGWRARGMSCVAILPKCRAIWHSSHSTPL